MVDSLDAVNPGNFLDVGEDGFELPPVGNFQVSVNARVGAVRTALEIVNVGARAADHGGDFRQQSGAVARANRELHRERRAARAAPFDRDAPLRLVHQILHVGASARVHRHAAPARDVAHNLVAGNRITALCAVHQQIAVSLDDQRRFAKSQHSLDGFDQRGCGIGRGGFFRHSCRFIKQARKDLPSGVFSESHRCINVLEFRESIVSQQLGDLCFGDFLQTLAKVARFVFDQALAHFHGFFALLLVNPVADFAFRRGRLHEAEPVPARMVALLRENLDHIAGLDFMPQRNHLPIHFGAHALVAHFRVHHISKIHGRGAARQFQHAPFGRKRVDFHRREIHLQRGKKFARLLHFLRPLDELPHPRNALIVLRAPSNFVLPVRRHAFFRHSMHVLRADLHFKGLPAVQERRVERLVQIWARNRDVIFEASGHWPPDVMDHA